MRAGPLAGAVALLAVIAGCGPSGGTGDSDLQLAIDSLFHRGHSGSDVTIAMRLENGSLVTEMGPFPADSLRRELADERAGDLGLRRILDTVMDGIETRDGNGGTWITLRKRLER